MQTFIKLMHWMPTRVASVLGGLWVVISAADLSPTYAFLVASLGTVVAVTGIADISLTELVVDAARARSGRAEERAA
jgi:hypothetical protein